MYFSRLDRRIKTILIIQCIAMLMGTSTHVLWAIENGFLSEHYHANLGSMLFWDALTFLNPIAALLLIVRPKIGVYLTLAIITVDVVHNNIFYFEELYQSDVSFGDWLKHYWMILGQIVFLVFVWVTIKSNLKSIRKSHDYSI